nr:AAA family ATPase [uncultured Agathobaculum sp.]
MKLTLKNIGKIGTASVEINGITVIAGENNTGKSTVGRALFAVFNSFCNVQKQIENERVDSIENLLDRMYMNVSSRFMRIANTNEIAKTIVAHIDSYRQAELSDMQKKIMDLLVQYDEGKIESFDENTIAETVSRIKDVLNVSDMDFLKSVLERKLDAEFNEQVCNIFSEDDGEIQLQIEDAIITVSVENKGAVDIQNAGNISLQTEVVYIDDPFVLDDLRMFYRRMPSSSSDHRYHLCTKLFSLDSEANVFDEIVAKDKLNSIYEKISSICSGDVIRSKRSVTGYQRKGSDKVLNVRNLSTGLKTFVILKMLLKSGVIERNGTIILDEPEIHLHPEWQLLFAELIVLIQKEFGVHVLLNTHSPYFLNAIEVYTVKYGVDDKCKYYLAFSQDDISSIRDVTDHIEAIYSKLARPLQDLENERGQL